MIGHHPTQTFIWGFSLTKGLVQLFGSQQEPYRILRIFPSITLLKKLKEIELRIGPEKGPDKSERK